MATYNDGVLGSFSGKLGPIIGSNWRGKSVMRSVPTKSTKVASAAQQLQRDKFKFVLQFLTPLKGLLTETFGANVGAKTPFNNAMSYHMKAAVSQTPIGFNMDYSKVLIGMGGLCGIKNPTVYGTATNALNLTWDNNSEQGLAYPTDDLLVVAYTPTLNNFDFFMAYSQRGAGVCTLDFQEAFYGETVHLWATFTNTNLALSATSSYLGAFVV